MVVIERWSPAMCVDYFGRLMAAESLESTDAAEDRQGTNSGVRAPGPVARAVRAAFDSLAADADFASAGTVEILVKNVEAQRTARLVVEAEDAASTAAAAADARPPGNAGGKAAGSSTGARPPPTFFKAAYRPREPYSVADVERAAALVRQSFGGPRTRSTAAGAAAAAELAAFLRATAAEPPQPAPLGPEAPLRTKPLRLVESEAETAVVPPRAGATALLEAALAAVGYDAQRCLDVCSSRSYPAELLAVATALGGGDASPAAVRAALDEQAGPLAASLVALIASQLAELRVLDAEAAAATTPEAAAAVAAKRKERRKMRAQWCTVCLRPECGYRPIVKEWEE